MITFSGNRRNRNPEILHAEEVIYNTYGDTVRVSEKNKDLLKFGTVLSTAGTTEQTIAEFQGSTLRETYATTNSIDSIICTDSTPFTGTLVVEGHTISGGNLTFVSQSKALNGQTAAALDTPIARATRAYITGSSTFAASSDVAYVYDSTAATGTTSGVPDVAAASKLLVNAVEYQSQKGGTSLSSTDYWIITRIYAGIDKKTGAQAVIRLRSRTLGNVFRTIAPKIHLDSDSASADSVEFEPFLIIPKNSDIELTIAGSVSGIQVSAGINGYLAKVI